MRKIIWSAKAFVTHGVVHSINRARSRKVIPTIIPVLPQGGRTNGASSGCVSHKAYLASAQAYGRGAVRICGINPRVRLLFVFFWFFGLWAGARPTTLQDGESKHCGTAEYRFGCAPQRERLRFFVDNHRFAIEE